METKREEVNMEMYSAVAFAAWSRLMSSCLPILRFIFTIHFRRSDCNPCAVHWRTAQISRVLPPAVEPSSIVVAGCSVVMLVEPSLLVVTLSTSGDTVDWEKTVMVSGEAAAPPLAEELVCETNAVSPLLPVSVAYPLPLLDAPEPFDVSRPTVEPLPVDAPLPLPFWKVIFSGIRCCLRFSPRDPPPPLPFSTVFIDTVYSSFELRVDLLPPVLERLLEPDWLVAFGSHPSPAPPAASPFAPDDPSGSESVVWGFCSARRCFSSHAARIVSSPRCFRCFFNNHNILFLRHNNNNNIIIFITTTTTIVTSSVLGNVLLRRVSTNTFITNLVAPEALLDDFAQLRILLDAQIVLQEGRLAHSFTLCSDTPSLTSSPGLSDGSFPTASSSPPPTPPALPLTTLPPTLAPLPTLLAAPSLCNASAPIGTSISVVSIVSGAATEAFTLSASPSTDTDSNVSPDSIGSILISSPVFPRGDKKSSLSRAVLFRWRILRRSVPPDAD
uniref:Uncharacterized protein n=1 Tax=Anopheles farauti TaxID=69004 RepID=A0A182Q5U2_9DIPT